MAQIGLAVGPRHDPLLLFAFTLLTCGFLIKAAIFPFHLWLPDAHAVAPTPVCVLFSGLMVELGLYAVLRLRYVIFAQTFADHGIAFRAILLAFAAATVLVGGFMCYSEHHLKRVLAYSTVCHAGLMLAAMAIGGPLAAAAMLTYLLAHAFIKSGLFFTSGILLHRLRSISEHILYQRGKPLRWTPVLWFLGGAGLAAMPPFGLMLGEAAASTAADNAGVRGIEALFILGGALTAAAVFRIGMHTFFGWGAKPITDEAAMIGELPETDPANTRIRWYHFAPPALCLVLAAGMIFVPVWLPILRDAAARLVVQSAYLHTVYTGQPTPYTLASWRTSLPGAALRGSLATALALLLACSSVFREQLPRRLRIGAFVERGWKPLRDMQSGHPGDYVLWLTMGVGVMGSAVMLLLRP
jgi:multicomponent Na+:H+ antiporter subunit D